MQVLITENDTHSPEKWADAILNELVPFVPEPPNGQPSMQQQLRVIQARLKIKPALVDTIAELRNYERSSYNKLSDGEKELVADSIRIRHGRDSAISGDVPGFDHLHEHINVQSYRVFLDKHIQNICRAVVDCGGVTVPSNEMVDRIWNMLENHLVSVQLAERSHFTTSSPELGLTKK